MEYVNVAIRISLNIILVLNEGGGKKENVIFQGKRFRTVIFTFITARISQRTNNACYQKSRG